MEVNSGGYPPLFTDSEVNNCFSIYQTSEITSLKIIAKACQRHNCSMPRLWFSETHKDEELKRNLLSPSNDEDEDYD